MPFLSRVCKYMDWNTRKMLMKTFLNSQFSCFSLVWMFHSRNTENWVSKIHERALRLVYHASSQLSFDKLLIKDWSVTPRNKSSYSELFWSIFSRIWTEYGEKLYISPYSVQMWENTDQHNSLYGHFSRSVSIYQRNC